MDSIDNNAVLMVANQNVTMVTTNTSEPRVPVSGGIDFWNKRPSSIGSKALIALAL